MQTFESFKCKTNGVGEMVLYSLQNPEKYWIIQVDVPKLWPKLKEAVK